MNRKLLFIKFLCFMQFLLWASFLFSEESFYVQPMTIEFPSVKLNFNGSVQAQKGVRKEITFLGNFQDKLIKLNAKKSASYRFPFSVLENLLYIFQYSKDFSELSNLLAPSLTYQEREFFTKQLTLPNFKENVRAIKTYLVYGYYLDKCRCVVLYSISSSMGQSCARFILVFEKGRWYLGDQLCEMSKDFRYLSAFLQFFPKDFKSDLVIKMPPNPENLVSLSRDSETISFYNKLATFYGFSPFSINTKKPYTNEFHTNGGNN